MLHLPASRSRATAPRSTPPRGGARQMREGQGVREGDVAGPFEGAKRLINVAGVDVPQPVRHVPEGAADIVAVADPAREAPEDRIAQWHGEHLILFTS